MFKWFRNWRNYRKTAKMLHSYHPDVYDSHGNIIGLPKPIAEKIFKTKKHTYVLDYNLSYQEVDMYFKLSNLIECGGVEAQNKIGGVMKTITELPTGKAVDQGYLIDLSITLSDLYERVGPEYYQNFQKEVLKICTLFLKKEGQKEWSEDQVLLNIEDWKTGIVTPNIGYDYLFFFGLYVHSKVIFMGNSNGRLPTSWHRVMGKKTT